MTEDKKSRKEALEDRLIELDTLIEAWEGIKTSLYWRLEDERANLVHELKVLETLS